ncbi:hypothetical protein [Neptuniibacter halophilus]|uniref:hypothetical protein n=1 Tax=Neptuniibacter halophilus TaxID=651666 RepID=UPI0025723805|nr:hypothetical protein [Neptuniibacter halophilus]
MIDPKTATFDEMKKFAEETLNVRVAHNISEDKLRAKLTEAIAAMRKEPEGESDPVAAAEAVSSTAESSDLDPDAEPDDGNDEEGDIEQDPELPLQLNRSKAFGTVRGLPGVAFYQDGEYFDNHGNQVELES